MELLPILDASKKEPLYMQLYLYVKQEIKEGRLTAETKLPSRRKLSDHLCISLNTVDAAYQQLLAEGYIYSKLRKGLYVNHLEEELKPVQDVPYFYKKKQIQQVPVHLDFNQGNIDLAHFPISVWKKVSANVLDNSTFLLNGDPQGEEMLRKEICSYLHHSRGVQCSPDQIIIGSGTQYLVSLLGLIIGRERFFSMEDPGFHRIRHVLEQGSEVKFIPLDDDGISMPHLYESRADVVYITPSHQFPTGKVMPLSRRLELLKWAKERNGYIIEDDYDGEFRHTGKPILSLQGLLNTKVIYLGTFSKSLIPSSRVSYMILPVELATRYHDHYYLSKQTVSRHLQETLSLFISQGHWETHVNKMRTVYKRKHKLLLEVIGEVFGDKVTIIGEKTGLHILMTIHNHMSEAELLTAAQAKQVKVYPTSIYFARENSFKNTILLGYGGLSVSDIDKGVRLLNEAWF